MIMIHLCRPEFTRLQWSCHLLGGVFGRDSISRFAGRGCARRHWRLQSKAAARSVSALIVPHGKLNTFTLQSCRHFEASIASASCEESQEGNYIFSA